MSCADVHKFLLSDVRIAARITEILGRRVADLEQRVSDSVFKSVPQRIAATLTTLADLHEFAGCGLLRLARGRITVLDPERLNDAAG